MAVVPESKPKNPKKPPPNTGCMVALAVILVPVIGAAATALTG